MDSASEQKAGHEEAPVDLDWLAECADGDDEAMKDMVALYFKHTEKHLGELHAAVEAGASEEVRRIAHASAGASGTCGMRGMARLLANLELTAADGKLENAAAAVTEATNQLAKSREFAKAHGLI